MKRAKEIKGRIASLLIASLLAVNIIPTLAAMPKSGTQVIQSIDGKEAMKVGETQTLKAVFKASGSDATPPDATDSDASDNNATPNVEWESSNEDIIEITPNGNTCSVKALKKGSATITATAGGVPKELKIKVSGPTLTAKLSKSTIAYSGEARLTAEVKGFDETGEVEIVVDATAVPQDLLIEEDDDTTDSKKAYTVSANPDLGQFGAYTITVEASVNGVALQPVTCELKVNAPTFKMDVDSTKLDLKDNKTTTITANSEFEYEEYNWSVNNDVVEIATSSDASVATVIAKKAGTATVTVKSHSEEKVGPQGVKVAAAKNGQSITFTVKDSREFKAEFKDEEKPYLELDINKDPNKEKRSDSFKVLNDYDNDFTVEILDQTQDIDINVNGEEVEVIVPAEVDEIGSATLLVVNNDKSADEKNASFEVPVIIKSSAIPIEVTPDVKVEADVTTATKSTGVDTSKITDPAEAARIRREADAQKRQITAAFDLLLKNTSFISSLADHVDGVKEIAEIFGSASGIEPGDNVKVFPKQELKEVKLEPVVTIAEDGTATVETFISSISYDISLFFQKMNDLNKPLHEAPKSLDVPKSNTAKISVPVPLPTEGIKPSAKYAKVLHGGDEPQYCEFQELNGNRFIVIETTHFSVFTLSFVDEIPTNSTSTTGRGGGRSGSSAGIGRWIQTVNGWWYRNVDGTFPANTWKSLLWNNTWQWYRFNQDGYMVTGWFVDVDGNKYFLHNIPDGSQGRMYTGWNLIEGKWYYFREMVGGPVGSLMTNGVTPDGHIVDANGVCADYVPTVN